MVKAILSLMIFLFFVLPGPPAAPESKVVTNQSIFTSSQVCGNCHQDIYAAWKESMHALSFNNAVFQAAYKEVYADTAGAAKYFCLKCHAPTALLNNDYDLRLPITREGVTCDFCHSIRQVSLKDGQGKYQLTPGEIKRGPKQRGLSPAHKVERSSLHTSSLFCAPCHQGHNAGGLQVRSTYLEWESSPLQGTKKECQDCHMGRIKGQVVSDKIFKAKEAVIRNHKVSLSLEKLRSAGTAKIWKVERGPKDMTVWVELVNVNAGHMLPTGSPLKKLILTVKASFDDGQLLSQSRTYEKLVLDNASREVKDVPQLMLNGQRVAKDNRLAPQERRLEKFVFPVAKGKKSQITADLNYIFAPSVFSDFLMKAGIDRDMRASNGKE